MELRKYKGFYGLLEKINLVFSRQAWEGGIVFLD